VNHISPYLTMAFLGGAACLATQYFNFIRAGSGKKMTVKILALTVICILAGVLCALLGFWLTEGIFRLPPGEWLNHSGFTACHLLLGMALSFLLGCKILKLDIHRTSSIAVPSIVVFMAFGRVGCSFAGCCYGIPMHFSVLGYQFERFPTAQTEALFFWLLFIALQLFIQKHRVTVMVLSYSILRFFLEFLRGDDRGTLIPGSVLSPAQTISLLLIAVTLGAMLHSRKNHYFRIHMALPSDQI
jgi:phosphatidylglycerol:prolipoprotein diacylglycerol transferase